MMLLPAEQFNSYILFTVLINLTLFNSNYFIAFYLSFINTLFTRSTGPEPIHKDFSTVLIKTFI